MHSNLTVRELMVILKHMGIKTIKIHNNGKIYDVFSKRDIDGIQDFEFLNNLHEYRRIKQIRDEWSKEPLIDYTPEETNMKNASDELLRQDDVYYVNEDKNNKNNMKTNNKKLYESIMASIAKEVKKALNEDSTILYMTAGELDTFDKCDITWLEKIANQTGCNFDYKFDDGWLHYKFVGEYDNVADAMRQSNGYKETDLCDADYDDLIQIDSEDY